MLKKKHSQIQTLYYVIKTKVDVSNVKVYLQAYP